MFKVSHKVWVYAMGSYYAGEVVKVGSKLIHVRYTSGAGVTRTKAVNPVQSPFAPFAPLVDGLLPKPRGARGNS